MEKAPWKYVKEEVREIRNEEHKLKDKGRKKVIEKD